MEVFGDPEARAVLSVLLGFSGELPSAIEARLDENTLQLARDIVLMTGSPRLAQVSLPCR